MSVLLADIGGTHARFAIMTGGKVSDIYRYRCQDFKNAYHAIQSFLGMCDKIPEFAVVAMAGPVINGKGCWTNLSWQLSEIQLKRKFNFKAVKLVNDLVPQGYALRFLKSREVVRMTRVTAQNKEPKILISIGTGLGCCMVIDGKVYPCEYGQTLLPDASTLESSVSGRGIKRIYFEETGKELSASMIENRMIHGEKSAQKTYERFYCALARAVQNIALIMQPKGGLYLSGGMLSESDMGKTNFISCVQSHPKMTAVLKTIPIYLITNRDLAFVGLSKLAKKYGWT